MKKMFRDSACLTFIRAASIITLLIPMFFSCRQPEEDYSGEVCFDVTIETFARQKYAFNSFAFTEDGTGYATINLITRDGLGSTRSFGFVKTDDKGRTWQRIGRRKGHCKEIRSFKDCLYFLVRHFYENQDSIRLVDHADILKCYPQDNFRVERVSRFGKDRYGDINDVYGFNIFNDSTFVCIIDKWSYAASDSLVITKDSGMTWSGISLPGKFLGSGSFAYSDSCIYAAVYEPEKGQQSLFVKDAVTGDEKVFYIKDDLFDITAAGNLFTTQPQMTFWKYDGENMERISAFHWNPSQGYGTYHPEFLVKKGDLVIGAGLQFTGKEGMKSCVFGSIDGGYHWKPLMMADDIHCERVAAINADEDSDSLSVLFARGGIDSPRTFNILTLKKKPGYNEDSVKHISDTIPDTESGSFSEAEKEVYDLLLKPLIEYYEKHVPGFSVPDIY